VLVLTQAYDGMPEVFLLRAMDAMQERGETTIVYFTYENIDMRFDSFLRLGHEEQTMVDEYDELCEVMGLVEHPMRVPLSIYGENAAYPWTGIPDHGRLRVPRDKFTTLNASVRRGRPRRGLGLLFFFVSSPCS
jgi:hypothetical protein